MARVADALLEQLKREVSVRRLAEAKGVSFKQSGDDNLLGRCPFHEDKTPSFVVSEKKNLWHCLGACRAGGSVIDFVMRAEGVNFRHAVELLREGVDLSGPVGPSKATVPKLPSPVDAAADDATLLAQVRDYYHSTLKASPEALAYLDLRGLKHPAVIDSFKLGFSNRTLGLRLPHNNRALGAAVRSRLQHLGVVRDTGHEHLRGSLVVPLHDEAGAVVGMYGRKVTPNLRHGTPDHLYLPGPHRTAFNSAALAGQRSAIVCEAVIDALSFWAAGFRNVTAAYGVEGFTAHHIEALTRHQVRDVLLAFDRDDAGDAAAEAVGKQLQLAGFQCWRVQFPRGMDANEYAVKVQPAAKSLGVALRQAAFMGSGLPPAVPSIAAAAPSSSTEVEPPAPPPLAAKPPEPTSAPPTTAVLSGSEAGKRVAGTTALRVATAEATPAPAPSPPRSTTPTAAVAPAPSAPAPTPTISEDEVTVAWGPRRYRVRGVSKPHAPDSLRLNVLLSHRDAFHVDTFDFYSAKARTAFVLQAAAECGLDVETVKRDVGQLLLQLEGLLEERRAAAAGPKTPTLTEAERDAALELLRAPNLLDKLLEDFTRCGVVGEETNKLVGYLAAVSRKLEEPLAVLIQSSSAAGKSSLMEAVLAFVPEEDKVKYSAMTGQSLFYMGDADLKHKVLAIVEEEGAAKASYALKLLQSEGELTIASTGKDPHTGRLVTHEYHVEGPTQLFLTTTASELDEELLNRCLVLTVDEDAAQTAAIHQLQRARRTLEGRLGRTTRAAVLALHANAQRLLRPLTVVNAYAPQLKFPDSRTRLRRDFPKYLTLIDAIALLHQHQRPVKTASRGGALVEYVEVTPADIEAANRLAAAVLGRTLDDLPPQTRRLLHQLETYAARRAEAEKCTRGEVGFTRRELREVLGIRNSQLAVHLSRLVDFEYLVARREVRGLFSYSLADETGAPAAPALTAVEALGTSTASQFPGCFRCGGRKLKAQRCRQLGR